MNKVLIDQIVAIDQKMCDFQTVQELVWNILRPFCQWIDRSNFAKIIASSALYIIRKDC